MNDRISTGTGLALLAGAITLHAIIPPATGSLESAAQAAWLPVAAPTAITIHPQQSGPTGSPGPASASVIGIAVAPTPSSGSGVVVFRLWSNGNIDRRLVNATTGLSYQNGWQALIATP
jgi:hypothetical protein